jgi:hypothetical protein
MRKNAINFYESFNEIKYKDYEIDHSHNLILITTLLEFHDKFKSNNIEFKLTGVWGLIFETNQLYRTINDLDLIIQKKDLKKCVQILKNDYFYLVKEGSDPKDFFLKSLKRKSTQLFRIKNKSNNTIVDLFLSQNFNNSLTKIKKFNNYIFKYRLPFKFLKFNTDFNYKRKIDNDDLEFYKKVIAI